MKLILLTILAFSLSACIETGDTTIDNSVRGDTLTCTDSECTLAEPGSDVDAVIGLYNPDYTQVECNAAGFFYCTVEGMCLDQPLDTGTCGS